MDFGNRKINRNRLNAFAVRKLYQRRVENKFKSALKEKIVSMFSSASTFRLFTPGKTIFLSAVLAALLIFTAINLVRGISLRNIVFFLGKDLATDSYGHTNILLMGTGGGNHEGADLTDTLILASIEQETSDVSLVSIPRDLFVTNEKIRPVQGTDGTRINNLYHIGKNDLNDEQLGLRMLLEKINEVTGVEVHYFIKVDFEGFKEIVDALDGIDVKVPEALYDTEYPRGENIGYEIFAVSSGMQHFDGEKALKYARSRKTTNDFDRSKRQQLILYAMKEKAEKLGILGNSGKISSLYASLKKYVQTDLTLRELITLAKKGTQVQRDAIATYSIHDDPTKCGGLLYSPARDLYGGASVLVEATKGYSDIHRMIDIVVNNPEFHRQNISIQILNGTKSLGLAAESKILLSRLCASVIRFGNGQSKDVTKTTYYLKTSVPGNVIEVLQKLIPGTISSVPPQKYLDLPYASEAQIIIEIGSDYLPYKMKDPYDFLIDLIPKEKTVSGEAETTDNQTDKKSYAVTEKNKPLTPNAKSSEKKK